MAPTSHLLVYYSTEKGEIINDVISFNVKQTDPKVHIITIRCDEDRYNLTYLFWSISVLYAK